MQQDVDVGALPVRGCTASAVLSYTPENKVIRLAAVQGRPIRWPLGSAPPGGSNMDVPPDHESFLPSCAHGCQPTISLYTIIETRVSTIWKKVVKTWYLIVVEQHVCQSGKV
jgi:hypothetical protein